MYDNAYEVVRYKEYKTWDELKAALKSKFIIRRSQGVVNSELINAKQLKNMDIRSFASQIQTLLDELNEICVDKHGRENQAIITKLNECTALESFQNGLSNPFLQSIVKSSEFETLTLAIEKALDQEISHKPESSTVLKCNFCNKKGHIEDSCFKKQNISKSNKLEVSANRNDVIPNNFKKSYVVFCHKNGHLVQNCFKKQNKSKNPKENIQTMTIIYSKLDNTSNNSEAASSLVVFNKSENSQRPVQDIVMNVWVK